MRRMVPVSGKPHSRRHKHNKTIHMKNHLATALLGLAVLTTATPVRAADPAPVADASAAFLPVYAQTGAALAADDLAGAKKAAAALPDDADAKALADAADVKTAREAFAKLSLKAEPLAKGQAGYRVFHCPMVNKDWVQPAGTKVANPYYGKAMLTCGVEKKV